MVNNYHTHTYRCHHAIGQDEDYVKCAMKAGIKQLGFSDHTPWHYHSRFKSTMRMNESQLEEYVYSIRSLKEKYKDRIDILIGLECEYFEKYIPWLKEMIDKYNIDYIILGNHYYQSDELHIYFGSPLNKQLLTSYVDHCIHAIDTGLYSYIAHPDLAYFDSKSDFYKQEMSRLCRYAKEHDIPLEFNLLGLTTGRHYPNQ
ncbi:MAG: histidinol-phosphatase, partial [Faecalibacillus sp.]